MDPQVSEKITNFFDSYPVRTYKKGQILIHAGDDPDGILNLIEGKVKQYDFSYRGDEVVLNVFKPPAFFPMSYAINHTTNEYFFEAETDIELRRAPAEDVVAFLKDNPDVLFDLLSRVYRGTDGLLRRIAHLMASTAKSRVLYELVVECKRFGQEQDGTYSIGLNETDIGARAGLSRETVNREMSKLKSSGLIQVANKQITIPSLENLEAALGTEL